MSAPSTPARATAALSAPQEGHPPPPCVQASCIVTAAARTDSATEVALSAAAIAAAAASLGGSGNARRPACRSYVCFELGRCARTSRPPSTCFMDRHAAGCRPPVRCGRRDACVQFTRIHRPQQRRSLARGVRRRPESVRVQGCIAVHIVRPAASAENAVGAGIDAAHEGGGDHRAPQGAGRGDSQQGRKIWPISPPLRKMH